MSGFLEQCQFVLDKLICIAINQNKSVFRSKTMRYVEEKECNMDLIYTYKCELQATFSTCGQFERKTTREQ